MTSKNLFLNLLPSAVFLSVFVTPCPVLHAGVAEPASMVPGEGDRKEEGAPDPWWVRANDWQIGGIFFPGFHLNATTGRSTGDPTALATGGHSPTRDEPSIQAIEPNVSLRTKYLEGFANGLFYQNAEGEWDEEFEEIFLKIVGLPAGFSLKGGQFLTRFGTMNDQHHHAWDFVDPELPNTRFLGADGLILRGGQVEWELPLNLDPVFTGILTAAYGETRPHSHHHHHGEEEVGEHEHEEVAIYEESVFDGDVLTARFVGRYRFTDFQSLTGGISWAGGDNGGGRRSDVFGADLEFLWRENGIEPGGRAFRWRNELFYRNGEISYEEHGVHDEHEEHDEHDEHGDTIEDSLREWGLFTHAIYTWSDHLDTGVRLAWVEGDGELGLEERLRVSPQVAWWLDDQRRLGLRLQYDYDRLGSSEDEHTVWLQLNINLGNQNEVR